MRQGVTPTDDPRESPGTPHPVVCRHKESGRRGLYLGRRRIMHRTQIKGEMRPAARGVWAAEKRSAFRHDSRNYDFFTFQNTILGPFKIPVIFSRQAEDCTYRPSGRNATVLNA